MRAERLTDIHTHRNTSHPYSLLGRSKHGQQLRRQQFRLNISIYHRLAVFVQRVTHMHGNVRGIEFHLHVYVRSTALISAFHNSLNFTTDYRRSL